MQKKTRFKSPLRDAAVTFLCLGTAFCFLFLFWRDLNRSTTRSDKTRIATISYKNRIAQRKFSDRVVWERVNQNSPVYDGDIIRTADLAQATLHFDDGTSLDLYENTMIQIAYSKDGGLQISVDGGDVQVESSAESAVALVLDDGSKVTVDAGASLAAKSDSSGVRSVEVKSGSAQIVTETGAEATIASGESVSVEKGGEIQKRPVTVTSVPKDLRLLYVLDGPALAAGSAPGIPVTLSWNVADNAADKDAGGSAVTVETSRKKDFSEIATALSTTEKSALLRAEAGTLFWRVYTDEETDFGAQGKITVETLSALENVAPADESAFRYRLRKPRINFRWSGNAFVTSYTLTVSQTPDMRSPVLTNETTEPFFSTDALEEGVYYWSVTPTYTLRHIGTGSSPVRTFAVVKSDELRPPLLASPADGAHLVRRDVANASFMWKSELTDAGYELLVARDEAFSDIAYRAETVSLRYASQFDRETLPDGRYYWKVVRKAHAESDRIEDTHPESEVRSFSIEQYVPQEHKLLFPPESYSAEMVRMSDTTFVWKLGDDAPRNAVSVLQISKNADFTAMQLERTVTGSSIGNLLLAPGTYWWRVGVQTDDGIEGLTASRSFTVLKELASPEITAPSAESSVLTWNGSPVTVKWNVVSDADYYDVRVLDSDGTTVASALSVRGTSTKLSLSPERYTLRVQAVASETATSALRTGEASLQNFSVRYPDKINVLSPYAGTHIAGLDAFRRPTVFRWQDGKDAALSHEFVLYKKQSDGLLREVERIPQAASGIALERLTAGNYSWRITGSTRDGFPVDSALSSFTIDGVIPLSRPVLTSPANKLVMDFAYLRKNRTIVFSWLPVNGATDYTFVLYRKEANGTLTAVSTEKLLSAPQVKLKKLSMLDVGDFVWSVTAFTHAKDGFEEQRGETASGEFKVSFDRPRKVETIQPERMYAD